VGAWIKDELSFLSLFVVANIIVLDSARETLVTLRVVVLETDLEFDSLHKVALLLLGLGQELLDRGPHA
jgi:hypothetical protein